MPAPVLEQKARPAGRKTGRDLELPLALERGAALPLHRQLASALREAISGGRLTAGASLPSSRALAAQLLVSRGVVVLAFEELLAEGYLSSAPGAPTRVSADLPQAAPGVATHSPRARRTLSSALPPNPSDPPPQPGVLEFRLGQPEVSGISLELWRRRWRTVRPSPEYGDPQGDPRLREALCGYLGRSRGISVRPEQVLITSGCVQALDLLARACLKSGDLVALEEPGYPLARGIFQAHGVQLLPVPVDADGLRLEPLPEGAAAPLMLYCTPSHQYPLGARLSVARRLKLLEWAERNDVLLLEDDYDSEFRFDAPPLPALASLDGGGNVVYLGTFSKTLSPALRVGYVVAPPDVLERLIRFKHLGDFHSPEPIQRFLAEFVAGGDLERHIWRMRRVYAHKREVLREALEPISDVARLGGLEAGLHAHLDLNAGIAAPVVARHALERGVKVSTLERYTLQGAPRNALLLGYGGLTLEQIQAGAAVLCAVVRELAQGR